MQTISIKLQFEDELRRFFIKSESTYVELLASIKEILSIPKEIASKEIRLYYLDEEKEYVVLSSDLELETAKIICPDLLRINVIIGDEGVDDDSDSLMDDVEDEAEYDLPYEEEEYQDYDEEEIDDDFEDDVEDIEDDEDIEDEDDFDRPYKWRRNNKKYGPGRRGRGRRGRGRRGPGKRFGHKGRRGPGKRGLGKWNRGPGRRGPKCDRKRFGSKGKWNRGPGRRGPCKRGPWNRGPGRHGFGKRGIVRRNFEKDCSSSSSYELLSLEEIKSKIQSLFEEKKIMQKQIKEEMLPNIREKKFEIRDARKNPEVSKEEIVALRCELRDLKEKVANQRKEMRSTMISIRQLKKTAKMKAE